MRVDELERRKCMKVKFMDEKMKMEVREFCEKRRRKKLERRNAIFGL